jgi:hypothetical protein
MLILSACGFTPLHSQAYRTQQAVGLDMISVAVEGANITPNTASTVPRRYSELLKAEIEDQANPVGAVAEKIFRLDIRFTELNAAFFVNPDGTSSRGDLVYNSNYTIYRTLDNKQVASGTLNRTSSYNSSPTADYASYVSIEDARKRGMIELAQDYKLRLASLLPTLNNPTATSVETKPEAPDPALQPIRNHETLRPGY